MSTDSSNNFDVLVVGSGHAGIEAASAAARMNVRVCVVTLTEKSIGHMPCNPAVGGIGKGHIVFEIAALGGIMPELCSLSYLQVNMLNMSKGPAVQGLRLQIDKFEYNKIAQEKLINYQNITMYYGMVIGVIKNGNDSISGVFLSDGRIIHSKTIIITSGTFLNGLIHMGLHNYSGGRINEVGVPKFSDELIKLGISIGRLKTGTPARLDANSINFSVMQEQFSHSLDSLFQYKQEKIYHKKSCFVTRTNAQTHAVILEHAHLSPIYRGEIKGIAPRYCPSIEDKIKRFVTKDSHHIFVEPEGFCSEEWYPNGLSTSLPVEVQEKFLRTIEGFEKVKLTQPGYAIEYDFIHPNQLNHTLESKLIPNLFFAGQINGTTGYEEAAGQGIVAGINAAAKVKNLPKFILSRTESYIGVMIDDIITFGVDEPYRMFTSRAERRLMIRQDNTFYRLHEKAFLYNLISNEQYEKIKREYSIVQDIIEGLRKKYTIISQFFSQGDSESVKKLIFSEYTGEISQRMQEYILAELLYMPYYAKENLEIEKMNTYKNLLIPASFCYSGISGLSIELQQKLARLKPETIAQASMIQGMTPAAINLLIFKIRE